VRRYLNADAFGYKSVLRRFDQLRRWRRALIKLPAEPPARPFAFAQGVHRSRICNCTCSRADARRSSPP